MGPPRPLQQTRSGPFAKECLRIQMPDEPTLTLRAVLENVPKAIEWVSRIARSTDLDEQTLYQIQVSVDEACANVVEHAYAGMEPGNMEVSCFLDERAFVVRVRDWGRSFAPDEVAEPNVHVSLEERSTGGLGLFLIREFMDQVQYSFDAERGNELLMTKGLPGAD